MSFDMDGDGRGESDWFIRHYWAITGMVLLLTFIVSLTVATLAWFDVGPWK